MANEVRFKAIGLTTIEDLDSTPGWIHGDGRRIIPGLYPEKGFLIVKPIQRVCGHIQQRVFSMNMSGIFTLLCF